MKIWIRKYGILGNGRLIFFLMNGCAGIIRPQLRLSSARPSIINSFFY
jgi:hypothetical protein